MVENEILYTQRFVKLADDSPLRRLLEEELEWVVVDEIHSWLQP